MARMSQKMSAQLGFLCRVKPALRKSGESCENLENIEIR